MNEIRIDGLTGLNITIATSNDIAFIKSCAQQASLKNRDPKNQSSLGFLVSEFSEQQYIDFINKSDHFYIASLPDIGPVGFVLAYFDSLIDKTTEWTNTFLSYYLFNPFILIKQVCVTDQYASKGIGAQLYTHIANCNSGVPLVAAVVSDPPNHRSMDFHSKQGFCTILEIQPPADHGRPITIWWKANGYDGEYSRVKVIQSKSD